MASSAGNRAARVERALEEAAVLMRHGNCEEAARRYRAVLRFAPQDADLHYNLGAALAGAGKFAEAAKAFDAFVEAHPRSPLASDARFGGALAQAALGDKARAVSGFETFVKQDPQHPLARDAERALAALR